MLAFAQLDIFTEKAQIVPDRVKTEQDKKDKALGKETSKEVEPTFLGLLSQTFVDRFEFDIYGYVSITGFKYVVFKMEQRMNPVNAGTQERQMNMVLKQMQLFHTRMMQNPFFNFDQHGFFPGVTAAVGRVGMQRSGGLVYEEDVMSDDYSSSSCSSCNSSFNEQATAAPQAPLKPA